MLEHRFALATVLATLFLLVVGGLVAGTGSSLACPDWPTCYGSFSPAMTGGVEYEHTHRVVATMVGVLTIALCVLLWRRREDDRALAWMGVAALVLVIFQGLLGGLTVKLRLPTAVSAAHLATAMIYFSLVTVIAVRSVGLIGDGRHERGERSPLTRAAFWVTALVYGQVALGGLVRHTGAGLACPDLPFCNGAAWPVGQHPAAPVHMVHRYLAVVVAAVVLWHARRVATQVARGSLAARLAITSAILIALQFSLGVASVMTRLELVPVTAHLGVGAALLSVMVAQWIALRRGLTLPATEPGEHAPSEAPLVAGEAAR